VAFGPHGPRAPTGQPGDNIKIFFSTLALIALGGAVFYAITAKSSCFLTSFRVGLGAYDITDSAPRTISREWQEASNQRAKEMNLNPISGQSLLCRFVLYVLLIIILGISSEEYKGKGFVSK